MQQSIHRSSQPLATTILAFGVALTPLAAQALPFELNEDWRGAWNNSIVIAAAVRAKNADKQLVGYNNAPEHPGAKGAVSAFDDGNLNYQKGDLVSAPIIYTTDLELRYRDEYGVYGKARTWYDYAGENQEVRHGSVLNDYQPNETLDDSGYYDYNKFSGYELLDMYVFGNWDIGDDRLTGRLGKQSINWGESLLHLGINAFNPINFSALGRPGLRQDDALVPVNRIYGNLITKSGISLEAFYALDWEASHLPPCGTFAAGADVLADPGCDIATAAQPYTDEFQINTPGLSSLLSAPVNHEKKPGSGGQFGVSSRYFVEPLDTEFGIYYVKYNATTPVLNLNNCDKPVSTSPCTPLGGFNAALQYHEDVEAMAISAATGVRNLALSAELSQFRNLPVQRNFPTMLAGALRDEGTYADRMVAGSKFDGAFKADRTQLLLGGILDLGSQIGLSDASLATEFAGQWVTNLPGTDEERIGRNGNWGEAAYADGSCFSPTTNQLIPGLAPSGTPNPGCKVEGFATDFSWGYRMLASATFPQPGIGVDLQPLLGWSHDVEGYSVDASQVEGRQIVNLRLRTIYQRAFFVDVGRVWIKSNTDYDPARDKDVYTIAAGVAF